MKPTARFAHVNLVARDWPRLAGFYERVFGCVPVPPERQLSGAWLEQATALPGAEISRPASSPARLRRAYAGDLPVHAGRGPGRKGPQPAGVRPHRLRRGGRCPRSRGGTGRRRRGARGRQHPRDPRGRNGHVRLPDRPGGKRAGAAALVLTLSPGGLGPGGSSPNRGQLEPRGQDRAAGGGPARP